MSFVHLHTHSHYSLLDGVPKIPELVDAVKDMGMNAVALTDHGNMYGAIEFYQQAKKAGVKPIIGIETYVAPDGIAERKPKERPYHLILLATNSVGYQNLVKLSTIAQLEGYYYKPRIDLELLEKHKEGIIALSGCLSGEVARSIVNGGVEDGIAAAQKYIDILGKENFFLEVQLQESLPELTTVNKALLEIHERLGIEMVATKDSHYIHPDDSEAQDVMLCIQTKNLLADDNRMTMSDQDLSLSPPEQMAQDFAAYPRAVENTQKIADRVDIDIDLDTIQIPHFDLPDGVTPEAQLKQICDEGMKHRYSEVTPDMQKRLEYELDIINKTGYAAYFLIVQDFINWAKEQGVAVGPGRGSAAGSIVAYLTNITDVDPIKYELLFERFLNPERVSMPDIDTDFADIRRDDVLRYVEEKYGKDHVAQIITFGTMAARAALRDVGRVLGLSYGYVDKLAKMIPMFTTLDEALETVPELSAMVQQDMEAGRLIRIAKKLEGVVRHTSTHACAVVITKDPLDTTVPLQRDQEDGTIITQYSMNPIEKLGLLKMDFLGLKNLTIIERSLEIIEATTGDVIDIESIPLDDKKTFSLLKKANTIGVFQLESSGMRRYLKQLKPTEFEDIIAMVSLYRPGPMEFIPQYIDGKHGKREVEYIHQSLEPILSKTYGIAVYQEQVMEIALQLAGFSYGEADVLRKAVGKKIKSLLDEQEYKMIEGMVENGIPSKVAKEIWEFILPFARYGFNRSHAACYAMIAYRTAYLKANYPAQFMAALLTSDEGNSDRVALEIKHARELGIEVLAPDINDSFGTFSVVQSTLDTDNPRIHFGLNAIKQVGSNLVQKIVEERKQNGPYKHIEDLLERVHDKDLNKKSLESLVKAGALDCFGERNQFLMNIDVLLQFAKRAQTEAETGQSNLFETMAQDAMPMLTLEAVPEADSDARLRWEKELLGLYISSHPLSPYQEVIDRVALPIAELGDQPKKKPATVVGLVTYVKRITTKKGEPMLFVGLADSTSELEALVFPSKYDETLSVWQEEAIVKVVGKLSDKDGTMKILVEEASVFDVEAEQEEIARKPKKIAITVPSQIRKRTFAEFQQLITAHPGDIPVCLRVDDTEIDTKKSVHEDAAAKLAKLFGPQNVNVIQ